MVLVSAGPIWLNPQKPSRIHSRRAEKAGREHGFGAFRTFLDVGMDPDANEMACEMYRQHLATIIDDPKTAEGLMPRNYPIGCKRPVIDTDYYKTFNQRKCDTRRPSSGRNTADHLVGGGN